MRKKLPTSFTLSDEGKRLLAAIAIKKGISRGAVLETLIRQEAKKEKVS